jgi:hypothetical protein
MTIATTAVGAATGPDATSRPCLRCGYELRGLPSDGRCPECGLSVARSAVPNDELRQAPPCWLASLSWGVRLLLVVMAVAFLWGRFVAPRWQPPSLEWALAIEASTGLLYAAGVWLLARPQPRFGVSGPTWRWALRISALSPLLHSAATYYVYVVWSRPPFRAPPLVRVAPEAATLLLIPLPALLFLHLRRLALRLPDRRLAERCAVVGVGGTACIAVGVSMLFVGVPVAFELSATSARCCSTCGPSTCSRASHSRSRAPDASACKRGGARVVEQLPG